MSVLKRTICMVLSISLLFSLCLGIHVHASGEEPRYYNQASVLYELGLFKGTGTNADGTPIYDLLAPANRIQGLVMLIRLLGEEQDALAFSGACPFTDVPAWAQKYAAYAYAKGYTKGTTATTFGADDALLGKAYLTFVLRALGYSDANGDFSYNDANTFATNLALIAEGQCEGNLLRDDCVMVSHNALRQKMKGTETKLAEKLVSDGVLTTEAVQKSGLYSGVVYIPYDPNYPGVQVKDIQAVIPEAVFVWGSGNSFISQGMYSEMNLSSILLSSKYLKDYLLGRKDTLPEPKQATTGGFNMPYGGLVTILDQDFRLIGYGIVLNGYKGTTQSITTCYYDGTEEIERVRELLGKVQKLNTNLVYREAITTTKEDGIQETVSYLRIDESKLPSNVQGITYYTFSTGSSTDDFLMAQTNLAKDDTKSSMPYFMTYGVAQIPNDVWFDDDTCVYLYDQNKDLIAYAKLPKTLPVVETNR